MLPDHALSWTSDLVPRAALNLPDRLFDPVAIPLGFMDIHWYGLGYILGILFGWWFAKRLVSTPRLWAPHPSPIAREEIEDFIVWAALGIILGGRLGYVLFYNAGHYAANPLEAFAIWDGGMSFHGGALGTIVAMVLFARSRGFTPYSLLDVAAISSCIGLFLVRCTNFINSELYGRVTDVAWAVRFPLRDETGAIAGYTDPRHPSQLYEALLEGVVLFAVLCVMVYGYRMLRRPGFVGGAWVFGYGASRIAVEFFRQPDAHIGYMYAEWLGGEWFTRGMLLSLPMLAIGAWGMWSAGRREPWRRAEPLPAT